MRQRDALEQIRILLVDMPRLAREMIDAAVAAQKDMRVVATTADPGELVAAAQTVQPSFVIVGLDGDDLPAEALSLFDEQPRLRVLGLEAGAGRAYLWQLRPEKRPLGEMSPAEVVEVIRGAATPAEQ
jgi:DNA-binding NarL/FixJ family response regulator